MEEYDGGRDSVNATLPRRRPRPSQTENAVVDMKFGPWFNTARERGGNIIVASGPLTFNAAEIGEFTNPAANGGLLWRPLHTNDGIVKATVTDAVVKVVGIQRPRPHPWAAKLLDYLASLNGGAVTYAQFSPTDPSAIEILMRGWYVGARDVVWRIGGGDVAFRLETTGSFLFSGQTVAKVGVARKGRLLDAQLLLDASFTAQKVGRIFDLDEFVATHTVERETVTPVRKAKAAAQ